MLRTPAEPVVDFDLELRNLVKDLTETMLDAPGVGLAAPQIGVSLRVFTYHVDDDEPGHLVNPVLKLEGEPEEDDEGCLSLPGLQFPTPRAPARSRPASTCTATRSRSRAPSSSPAASSTRPTTSTASCSSTGSTRSSASSR